MLFPPAPAGPSTRRPTPSTPPSSFPGNNVPSASTRKPSVAAIAVGTSTAEVFPSRSVSLSTRSRSEMPSRSGNAVEDGETTEHGPRKAEPPTQNVPMSHVSLRTHDQATALHRAISDRGTRTRVGEPPPNLPQMDLEAEQTRAALLQSARLKLSTRDEEARRKLRTSMTEFSDSSSSQSGSPRSPTSPEFTPHTPRESRSRTSTLSKEVVVGGEDQEGAGQNEQDDARTPRPVDVKQARPVSTRSYLTYPRPTRRRLPRIRKQTT